jgi:tRNA1(Val) A37 N6-methylase TrmN6
MKFPILSFSKFFTAVTAIRLNKHTQNISSIVEIISKILKPNGKVLMTLDTKINNVENYLNNMIKSLEKYNFVVENINQYDTFIFLEIILKRELTRKKLMKYTFIIPTLKAKE